MHPGMDRAHEIDRRSRPRAVTFWVIFPPGFSPVNQESPFLLSAALGVPAGLAGLGGVDGDRPSPTTPCQSAIALQMWPGVKQFLRAASAFQAAAILRPARRCAGRWLSGSSCFRWSALRPVTIVFGSTNLSGDFLLPLIRPCWRPRPVRRRCRSRGPGRMPRMRRRSPPRRRSLIDALLSERCFNSPPVQHLSPGALS